MKGVNAVAVIGRKLCDILPCLWLNKGRPLTSQATLTLQASRNKADPHLETRRGARFFRHEERGRDGRVKGIYGFVDADNDLHVVVYTTDALGHRVRTETHEIEGYGRVLSAIMQKGVSTAHVRNQVLRILKQKKSYASPESYTSSPASFTSSTESYTSSPASFTSSTESYTSSSASFTPSPESFTPFTESSTSDNPPESSSSSSTSSVSPLKPPTSFSTPSSPSSESYTSSPPSYTSSTSNDSDFSSSSTSSVSPLKPPTSLSTPSSPSLDPSSPPLAAPITPAPLTTPLPPPTTPGYRRPYRQTPSEPYDVDAPLPIGTSNSLSGQGSKPSSSTTIRRLLPLRYEDSPDGLVSLSPSHTYTGEAPSPATLVTNPPSVPPDSDNTSGSSSFPPPPTFPTWPPPNAPPPLSPTPPSRATFHVYSSANYNAGIRANTHNTQDPRPSHPTHASSPSHPATPLSLSLNIPLKDTLSPEERQELWDYLRRTLSSGQGELSKEILSKLALQDGVAYLPSDLQHSQDNLKEKLLLSVTPVVSSTVVSTIDGGIIDGGTIDGGIINADALRGLIDVDLFRSVAGRTFRSHRLIATDEDVEAGNTLTHTHTGAEGVNTHTPRPSQQSSSGVITKVFPRQDSLVKGVRLSEVLHIIPSPDLSTGRPRHFTRHAPPYALTQRLQQVEGGWKDDAVKPSAHTQALQQTLGGWKDDAVKPSAHTQALQQTLGGWKDDAVKPSAHTQALQQTFGGWKDDAVKPSAHIHPGVTSFSSPLLRVVKGVEVTRISNTNGNTHKIVSNTKNININSTSVVNDNNNNNNFDHNHNNNNNHNNFNHNQNNHHHLTTPFPSPPPHTPPSQPPQQSSLFIDTTNPTTHTTHTQTTTNTHNPRHVRNHTPRPLQESHRSPPQQSLESSYPSSSVGFPKLHSGFVPLREQPEGGLGRLESKGHSPPLPPPPSPETSYITRLSPLPSPHFTTPPSSTLDNSFLHHTLPSPSRHHTPPPLQSLTLTTSPIFPLHTPTTHAPGPLPHGPPLDAPPPIPPPTVTTLPHHATFLHPLNDPLQPSVPPEEVLPILHEGPPLIPTAFATHTPARVATEELRT